MNNKIRTSVAAALVVLAIGGCQKMERPALGDYPKDDQVLPGGNLRFFVPVGGNNAQARFNVSDSISGNPAIQNSLTFIDGVNGKAVKGADQKAIKYMNANDFGKASSITVAFWEKNTVPTGDKAQFAFSVQDRDYWSSTAMFILFDHTGSGATNDSAVVKFYIADNNGDHWFELTGSNKLKGVLDNNWHHLAFTYDETTSNMKIYRDGALVNTLSWTGHGPINLTPAKVTNLILGGMSKHVGLPGLTDDWIQSWQGGLDQFRLYNKALSDAEILALYTNRQ